tara:strand:- start:732 stop:1127 length:396 start_codon:yes stop_codon:yes gene_type:complete
MDKSTVLKAFNNHLFEFIDDVISAFPDNNDIKTTKTFFELTKKGNVTLLIKAWYTHVYIPYNDILAADNLEFFITKDYSQDISNLPNMSEILVSIDKIRNPIKEMSDENKQHSLKYLKNLNKLSKMYDDQK